MFEHLGKELESEWMIIVKFRPSVNHIHCTFLTLSLLDRLVIDQNEYCLGHQDLLNQIGVVAHELSERLKSHLKQDPIERSSHAQAIQLLFEARQLSRQTWHSDVSEALDLYQKSLTLAPDDLLIQAEMAMVRARSSFIGKTPQKEDLLKAEKQISKAFNHLPSHPKILLSMGFIRFYQGQTEEALKYLETAYHEGADRSKTHDLLGRIQCETGPIPQAVFHLEQALELDPEHINTRIDLARLYAYQGRWSQVKMLLDMEVSNDVDFGARAISRARMDLWCRHDRLWLNQGHRNPKREGELFSQLSNLFEEVKSTTSFIKRHQKYLQDKIDSMPQDSRIGLLYRQFYAECVAFSVGTQHPLFKEVCQTIQTIGLADQLWLRCCPLFTSLSK